MQDLSEQWIIFYGDESESRNRYVDEKVTELVATGHIIDHIHEHRPNPYNLPGQTIVHVHIYYR